MPNLANAPDLTGLARQWRADLIVRESLEFAGCAAAEAPGLPHASVAAAADSALDRRRELAAWSDVNPTVPESRAGPAVQADPPTGETGPTGCTGRNGAAATSTAPAKPASAGMLMHRQRHDHNELQLPYPGHNGPGAARLGSGVWPLR